MPAESFTVSQQAVAEFCKKLAGWAATLDATQQAMLTDLLAKAGGDVYGNAAANRAVSPSGKSADASDLSPLEIDDFQAVIQGIFTIGQAAGGR